MRSLYILKKYFQFYFRNKHVIWFSVVALFFVFLSYGKNINHLYFSSDEWIYMGGVRTDGIFQLLNKFSFWDLLVGKGRPLGTLTQNILYQYFPYKTLPFVYIGLFFHFLNSLLVFSLVRRMTKSWLPAWITGLLFVSSSSYYQVFSWIACLIEIPISTFFVLLSLYTLDNFLTNNKTVTGLLFLCFSYVSFLFKDVTIYMFLFPVCAFFIHFIRTKKFTHGQLLILLISLGFFVVLSLPRFIHTGESTVPTIGSTETKLTLTAKSFIDTGLYPVIGITQQIIPYRLMSRLSGSFLSIEYYSILQYIKNTDTIANMIIADMLSISISVIIFFVLTYLTFKQRKLLFFYLFWIAFYFLQFIPIVLYSYRQNSYMESRYMYVSAIAVSAMIASGLSSLIVLLSKSKKVGGLVTGIVIVLVVIFCLKQASITNGEVNAIVYNQQDIKGLTEQMRATLQYVPNKPILFIGGSKDYYFYPGHKTPFQLGTGYISMILYYDKGVVPSKLIQDDFLIKFGEEGYKEVGTQAFGYFWNKEKLLEEYKANPNLSLNQVIAYEYDGQTKRLIPITDSLKTYIKENR